MTSTSETAQKPLRLSAEDQIEIGTALSIVGAEDFSNDGQMGHIEVHGVLANAIMTAHFPDEEVRKFRGLIDQPVRVSRSGHLEIWCNGFYVEGKGVRGLVHRAVRELLSRPLVADPQEKPNLPLFVPLQVPAGFETVVTFSPSSAIDEETRKVLEEIHVITSAVVDYQWIAMRVAEALKLGVVSHKLLRQALFIASEEGHADLIDRVNVEINKI
jgi:hypothetical protein